MINEILVKAAQYRESFVGANSGFRKERSI